MNQGGAAMRRSGTRALIAILITVTWASPARSAPYEHARHGWLVGIGLGGGSAAVTVPGGTSDREGGFAASLRAGYAFTPEVSLELNSTAWVKEQNSTTITFSVTAVAINYYPGATGFVLRGGVGVGSVDLTSSFGSTTYSSSESGLGL